MASFDFITDEQFRASLETDYNELTGCLSAGHWKAVHVLSGSIVEAVLIDYLVAAGLEKRDEALKMDLGTVIATCKSKGVISDRSAELSSVIRSYRNLIHPGRGIRLQERVDGNSAQVAQALVEMIVEEVTRRRRENYGYTAEQVVSKLERDSSADAILSHLLRAAKPREIERLLTHVLPQAILRARNEEFVPQHYIPALSVCFRMAAGMATEELKRRVATRFATILREEGDDVVASYGEAFFRATDLKYLAGDDAAMVRQHLFARLKRTPEPPVFAMLEGIGEFLTPSDAESFLDPIMRAFTGLEPAVVSRGARNLLEGEITRTSFEMDEALRERADAWVSMFESRGADAMAAKARSVKAALDFDLPFEPGGGGG